MAEKNFDLGEGIKIRTVHSYEPSPDFELEIDRVGQVVFTGHLYVGQSGRRGHLINNQRLVAVQKLWKNILARVGKYYFRSPQEPLFEITTGKGELYFIDKTDFLSLDYLDQIFAAADVLQWINVRMNLYLVMNRPSSTSKIMALVMAGSPQGAVEMFSRVQSGDPYELFALRIGERTDHRADHPAVFFTFSEEQKSRRNAHLVLNRGPVLSDEELGVFLFVSAGKRYNDPMASYFLGLGRSKEHIYRILGETYPHFQLPGDFQLVDLKMKYVPCPLFSTHLPIGVR